MSAQTGEVDRCVCFNVTFRAMKEHVAAHSGGLDALREHFGCGRGCALCVPYIRAMLSTGRTAFAVDDLAAFPRPDQPPV
jgi:bacterioferritin-associated ferredoxin